MARPVDIGTIPVCAGQAFSFALKVTGDVADAASFTGMVLNAQIREDARPSSVLVTPAVEIAAPVVKTTTVSVTATISVTEAQMASLPCTVKTFSEPKNYAIDIEGAYGDAPTIEAFRFYGVIAVYQGGIVTT
jgi:hypothetical protein